MDIEHAEPSSLVMPSVSEASSKPLGDPSGACAPSGCPEGFRPSAIPLAPRCPAERQRGIPHEIVGDPSGACAPSG